LCDGQRSVEAIADILGQRFNCDVLADVTEYLSQLAERELIRDG
jgi:Coenzyme PQQ synthesis protein D (PqqD)